MGYNTAISCASGITAIDFHGPHGNRNGAVVASDLQLMTASHGA
jgi:hypothetical protein